MKTVYEYLIADMESALRIAARYRREVAAIPSPTLERQIEHFEKTAKALEIAAKNLPVEVAEMEI